MNKLVKNFSYAFTAQGVSYHISIVTGLIVPKLLGVDEYAYWQLFVFYGGYANFCMLGVHDGMYLRLGGKEYNNLDFGKEGKEFKLLMLFEILLGILLIFFAIFYVHDVNRKFIFINLSFYIILTNASQYLGELFQAVNETSTFSKATMLNKIVYAFVILILLFNKHYNYMPYIVWMNLCALITVIYYITKGKELFVFDKNNKLNEIMQSIKTDASAGWKIMVGGYAALLIVGVGRGVIDYKWGITTFGKLSMAISLINLIMQFINQIAIVLFPALRTVDEKKQRDIYKFMRKILFFILPISYLLFYPVSWFIKMWLPQYLDSIGYLSILLPICVFDAKTNMLSLTYLKVLRKETKILIVNVFALCVNFILVSIGAFVLDSMLFVLIAMMASCVLRSVIFDLLLGKIFSNKITYEIIVELILMLTFIIGKNLDFSIVPILIIEYAVFIIIFKRKDLIIFKNMFDSVNRIK